jgi:hypothetical protein
MKKRKQCTARVMAFEHFEHLVIKIRFLRVFSYVRQEKLTKETF